ncbi:hypothetical protein EI982_07275 [Haloplanus rallus]|jgi:hypothetical protein|uniref:DUF7315 domain-containing protein n=1 Tax=Haloplanus rallus TaxID=1816183 RepID=A0A6B9FFK9_9EURY|nr:hypothetical protein [Haloplanus rallus]QGX94603.1 hypothetical protein EI982_07275 [Haloplanus rallus]
MTDSSDDEAGGESADVDGPTTTEGGRRDVVVPMRLYKTVTVFSTLIAVAGVVFGFVLLDAATIRLSLLRRLLIGLLGALGVTPPSTVLSAVLAVAGLVSITVGAGVYVLGTRFRARGMGNPQEDADESSDNG